MLTNSSLQRIRENLREALMQSPLCDGESFTVSLEETYPLKVRHKEAWLIQECILWREPHILSAKSIRIFLLLRKSQIKRVSQSNKIGDSSTPLDAKAAQASLKPKSVVSRKSPPEVSLARKVSLCFLGGQI